jgi:hypothetical protein
MSSRELCISAEVLAHPVEDYKAAWSRTELLTIENFLVPEDAVVVADFLEAVPESEWSVSVHPHHPSIYTFANTPENQATIDAAIKSAAAEYARGGFSYYFRRHEPAAIDRFDFPRFLMSEPCLSLLSRVTGLDLSASVSVFCSCYGAGCFLSTHTDTGRGKLAFVYNATRSWDDRDGGQFQLLTSGWSEIVATVQPRHNSLTFFRVEGDGVPHRVLPVSGTTRARRLAVSGWLV